jgi:hypothetical protein
VSALDTIASFDRITKSATVGIFVLVCLSLAAPAAEDPPLLALDFETELVNAGTLGGSVWFHAYAAGEEPLFGFGPFGRCLDLTAASRHGGDTPHDPPAGGAALFRDPALNALDSFTVVLWARQNPFTAGHAPARLLHKPGAWDLLPNPAGLTLMLGPDTTKVRYTFSGKNHRSLSSEWRFFAVAVSPRAVAAYTGGRRDPFEPLGEQPRSDTFTAAPGELALGNFGGIRPFNGWIDRVRLFRGALGEAAVRDLFDADLATARATVLPPVTELSRLSPERRSSITNRQSLIPFSARWPRTNALDAARAFHATHLLWVYGSDTGFVRRAHDAGLFYQGTLNGLQGQGHSTTNRSAIGDASGRHEDLDGNKNTPRWMVTFGPRTFTGCCNSPAFRDLFFADAERLVKAGVDSIHVDDWEMNASWVRSAGVCFCDACRNGFRDWLAKRRTPDELNALGVADIAAFDYRVHLHANGVPDAATYRARFSTLPLTPAFTDFQIESMRAFFREFRRHLDAWSPHKYIPASVNGLFTPLRPDRVLPGADVIDFLHGESSQNADFQTARDFLLGAKAAEAVGITQVVSPIPRSTARTRAAIATTYALGQPHLVPWDLYMGSDATGIQPRYFGSREQYGDLYDFVRDRRALLDRHAAVAGIGVLVNGDQPPGRLADFCLALAARQRPFRLLLGANRYTRVPLRPADLRGLRLVVELSPADTFCAEDQAVLAAARASGLTRFAAPTADLDAVCRAMDLDLLRLEGPENLYAFPRADPAARSSVIHLVNWNLGGSATERAETYRHVTVSLLQPARWGAVERAVWHAPGEGSIDLTPERHADCIRLTLPRLTTWGIIELTH